MFMSREKKKKNFSTFSVYIVQAFGSWEYTKRHTEIQIKYVGEVIQRWNQITINLINTMNTIEECKNGRKRMPKKVVSQHLKMHFVHANIRKLMVNSIEWMGHHNKWCVMCFHSNHQSRIIVIIISVRFKCEIGMKKENEHEMYTCDSYWTRSRIEVHWTPELTFD